MSTSASTPPTAEPSTRQLDPSIDKQIWTVGTLRYTKPGLMVLFFWLLCNDFCLMLMEQVPQLTPLLLKDHGASNTDIALYISTLASFFNIWINPVFSTWSDRHRGPYGRRRPFLLFATPLCALMLVAIPFAPNIAASLGLGERSQVVMVIGLCFVCYSIFNSVILAIFTYFFWDVVPEILLGRFSALTKMVSTAATFLWNYFFFGLAAHHPEAIFVGIAGFFLVIYMLSLWQVKEGNYPPSPPREKRGFLVPVRAYFVECFGLAYYRWIFAAFVTFQIGNFSNIYQIFYFRDDLGLSLDTIGKMRSWPSLALFALAYPLGILIDRFNPIRLVSPSLIVFALTNVLSFFFLRGQWSLLICCGLTTISIFIYGTASGVLNVEVFPREKLGQFCSATVISYQVTGLIMATPLGMLFDYIKDYRYVFLWSAAFEILSALLFIKVYHNWKKQGGRPPVSNAG